MNAAVRKTKEATHLPLVEAAAILEPDRASTALVAIAPAIERDPGSGAVCSELDRDNPDSYFNRDFDREEGASEEAFSYQSELRIARTENGSVSIFEPPGNGTQPDGETVMVAPENVVTFVRKVLRVAGFPDVEIIVKDQGERCSFPTELLDGDRASDLCRG